MSPASSRLFILAAALLFSTGGAAIKATSFGPWQVASFRSAVAAVALALLLPEARRNWNWRVLPPAAAYASTLILFVAATKLTTAANAIYLQATAPLFVLLAGPLLLRERLRRLDLLLAAVMLSGMALLFLSHERAVATAPDPFHGNLCALLSGVAWAATLVGMRWLGRKAGGEGAASMVVAGNALAFLAALPMALPAPRATPADVAVIVYLGLFQIALAYFFLTRAIRHVPAFEASMLLQAEPVFNPVWAWLVHGERPSGWALAGGALILAATALYTWNASKPKALAPNGKSAS